MKKIAISALLSGAIAAASLTGAFAASASDPSTTATQAAAQDLSIVRGGFTDPITGMQFFTWYPDEVSFESAVTVVKNKEGKWFKLNSQFGGPSPNNYNMGDGIRDPEYGINVKDMPDWYSFFGDPRYYLQLQDQIVFHGLSFYWSPDRKYGYTLVSSAEDGGWGGKSLLTKNRETGEIREMLFTSTKYPKLYWLDSSRLLLGVFNPKERKNEILLLDAADGSVKHFGYGTLKGFDPVKKETLFVYNEPTRTPYIMEAASGSIRKAAATELKRFEPKYMGSNYDIVDIKINPDTLEEWTPQIVTRYEQELISGDKIIPLQFAVTHKGTLYIPVKPLTSGLGLVLGEKKGTARDYNFSLQSADGRARVVLRPNNSIVLSGRLFTTRGVLSSLGFADVRIQEAKQSQETQDTNAAT
ncbi:hypothetical protein [Paenibacillus mendelii]|uniref:Copper amine oxidase-like N-terminal domain-containing protein n=1 Tax=Paenibacillus mendelii TaxID=206163 RepID=A0ABV6J916_9BACL|nr:hypothetical protein [Paenibacillus mendelii]MCQ6561383.1 hypothetical protein [Paenibacillus mendelii]